MTAHTGADPEAMLFELDRGSQKAQSQKCQNRILDISFTVDGSCVAAITKARRAFK